MASNFSVAQSLASSHSSEQLSRFICFLPPYLLQNAGNTPACSIQYWNIWLKRADFPAVLFLGINPPVSERGRTDHLWRIIHCRWPEYLPVEMSAHHSLSRAAQYRIWQSSGIQQFCSPSIPFCTTFVVLSLIIIGKTDIFLKNPFPPLFLLSKQKKAWIPKWTAGIIIFFRIQLVYNKSQKVTG